MTWNVRTKFWATCTMCISTVKVHVNAVFSEQWYFWYWYLLYSYIPLPSNDMFPRSANVNISVGSNTIFLLKYYVIEWRCVQEDHKYSLNKPRQHTWCERGTAGWSAGGEMAFQRLRLFSTCFLMPSHSAISPVTLNNQHKYVLATSLWSVTCSLLASLDRSLSAHSIG